MEFILPERLYYVQPLLKNVKLRCPPDAACIYFYFDFTDPQKQLTLNMLYSFLSQLSTGTIPAEVRQLYENCSNSTREATVTQLSNTLLSIAKQGKRIYIVMDALNVSRRITININWAGAVAHRP